MEWNFKIKMNLNEKDEKGNCSGFFKRSITRNRSEEKGNYIFVIHNRSFLFYKIEHFGR